MLILIMAFSIGLVAGLRAMMPLAVVAWGARLGDMRLAGTHLAWLGNAYVPWIFSVLAVGELINDKLPATPSRKVPPQFIARVVSGGLAGAAVGSSLGFWIPGTIAGMVGAVAGTLGGAAVRGKLGAVFGKDLPAALLEDVCAIAIGVAVVTHL